MSSFGWSTEVINIGLIILLYGTLTKHQTSAQDMLHVVQRLGGQVRPTYSTGDQISRPVQVDYNSEKKDTTVTSQIKKSHKKCKCNCSYANTKDADALKQCQKSIKSAPVASPAERAVADPPLVVNGIFPSLTVTASSGPTRTECGTGALMPWADKLYMVSYLSVPDGGNGTGLYAIDDNFVMTKLASHRSSYANRIIHRETNQIVIGAWVIDTEGRHRAFPELLTVRVAATAEHLTNPETMVYMLGMDGPLWECNVTSLECTQLFDLVKTLAIPVSKGEQPLFKAAHTMNGRLVVASNTFQEADFIGDEHGGRLAEWKGPDSDWTILAWTAFVEVTGRRNLGQVIYALGWDYRSVILRVFDGGNPAYPYWQTYRLPKGSHAYDHLWQTEWPRIREVETERYLMDMHGLFYELSPLGWVGSTWGIRPISQHLHIVPDFASYRGFLVLGGNQVSSMSDNNVVTGQSQSGLWFGKTDDLWSFGKPKGWGAVWRTDVVKNGTVSNPFLMTGFDKKVLHLRCHDGAYDKTAEVTIEVDFTGTAGHRDDEDWVKLTTINLDIPNYKFYTFPDQFSAHWVRMSLICNEFPSMGNATCKMTAFFHYT